MTVDVRQAISLVSQRIVLAPGQVEAPSPFGRGTVEKRFREGLITEAQFRTEMTGLGYIGATIDRSLAVAKLEHEFDNFQDRLTAIETALAQGAITLADAKLQILDLVPDQSKALLIYQIWVYKLTPKPKAVTPDEAPTLTVAKLLSAFSAGVLGESALRAELEARLYSPEDIGYLIAIEKAAVAKPKPIEQKLLTIAQLNAMLAAGIMTPAEFITQLLDRNYSQENAARLLGLEMIKINARSG
jgi:hypothetical protein